MFETGKTVFTTNMFNQVTEDIGFYNFVLKSLERYRNCDWGDTCEEDQEENNDAVKNGERILAVYIYPVTGESIWIITEWDRSVTTVLFPDEY